MLNHISHFDSLTETKPDFQKPPTPSANFTVNAGGNSCPDCGTMMIRLGSCFSCPACGFGSCG